MRTEEQMERLRKCCVALANWWADILRTKPLLSNGDRSDTGFMATALATIGQSRLAPLTEEQVIGFAKNLARLLEEELLSQQQADPYFTIGTDYHHDSIFDRATEGLGFELGNMVGRLPWKTMTWLERHRVSTSRGYGGAHEVLLDLRTKEERIEEAERSLKYARKSLVDYERHAADPDEKKAAYWRDDAVPRARELIVEAEAKLQSELQRY